MKGRVIDGLGNPLDDWGPLPVDSQSRIAFASSPSAQAQRIGSLPHRDKSGRYLYALRARPAAGNFLRERGWKIDLIGMMWPAIAEADVNVMLSLGRDGKCANS